MHYGPLKWWGSRGKYCTVNLGIGSSVFIVERLCLLWSKSVL